MHVTEEADVAETVSKADELSAVPNPCASFHFGDADVPRDLVWSDFREVRAGSLNPADAQVNGIIGTDEKNQRFLAILGSKTRVERGKKTDSTLEHERIHWRITCRVVELANEEMKRGGSFRAVFRVATEVHFDLNDPTGQFDRDAGTGTEDTIPKHDWETEWCQIVDRVWEETVEKRGLRTITF